MSVHPNEVLARQAWDALSRGDADALRALLAPDLVWHATARGTPWQGEHRGPEEILDFLARVGEVAEEFHASLVDVLASAGRVLVLFRMDLAVSGRRGQLDYALLARVERSRLAEVWTLPLDPGAITAMWSDGGRSV